MLSAYFKSKLENILFTVELARRLEGSTVTANCCGPGGVRTNFGNAAGGALAWVSRLMFLTPMMKSPEVGARTQVYLASSPEVAGVSGRFFLKCRARKTRPIVHRCEVATRLWRISEQLCKVSERPGDPVHGPRLASGPVAA